VGASGSRTLKLFSFLEFCLWNAYDDMTNYQRNYSCGEVEIAGSTIYHKTEYRERRNHFAFYHVNAPIAGFDTDRESFVGLYNGLGEPQVVAKGASSNSVAAGWAPIASHSLEVTLAPGEEKTFIFTLGYVENPVPEKWEKPAKLVAFVHLAIRLFQMAGIAHRIEQRIRAAMLGQPAADRGKPGGVPRELERLRFVLVAIARDQLRQPDRPEQARGNR